MAAAATNLTYYMEVHGSEASIGKLTVNFDPVDKAERAGFNMLDDQGGQIIDWKI